jgi:hypothetical protein
MCNKTLTDQTDADWEKGEAIIMAWAAENPEPLYPTWGEWLERQGVVTLYYSLRYEEDGTSYYTPMDTIRKPIPAYIAQKLGIEPKEGT